MAELGFSGQRMPKKGKSAKEKRTTEFTKREVLLGIVGFFLAMAVPYGGMAPFGLSFLAQERKLRLGSLVSFGAVSLGAVVVCDRLGAAKYIAAAVLYLAVLFVLERDVRFNGFTAALVAGGCVFVSGLIVLFWQGFFFAHFLLLLCETATVVLGAMVMENSIRLLDGDTPDPKTLSGEELFSLCTTFAIGLLSLREIYLGSEFSVMNTVATVVLLIVSAGCGAGYSTGAGVVLGLVCGMGTDEFLPILGAFCFCGFLSGVFSRFGKGGVIAGTVIANGILVVYTNGAMESVMSLYEIMAAAGLFCFVKPKVLNFAGEAFCLDEADRLGIARLRAEIKARLQAVAASFESMARTLETLSERKNEENKADLATFFDLAADKVCKKCKKISLCWNKDFDFTYKSLFELMQTMDEKGRLDPLDANARFRARCEELPHFVAELNHQLDIHQVRCVWRSRLMESRTLVGEQLAGVSKIIGGISEELSSDISFCGISDDNVRAILEKNGIDAGKIEVFQEKNGRCKVVLQLKKSCWSEEVRDRLSLAMKKVFQGEIMLRTVLWDKGRLVKIEVCDAENFKVETGFAEKAASEESGDNYRFSHISGGKYVIALSDGMGTGSRASRESEAMLELLDSFLRAGFDSLTAVKFINSIMLMKSGEEAFVTIDVCIIDLYTGEAEFIKTGAEPSFVMKQNRVDTVKASSLPVGVIADMEAEIASRTIGDGDVIVMVTDGVENRECGSMWISDFLMNSSADDSGSGLADKILRHAIKQNNGQINDDMTVLSVKLKKAS